MKTEKNFEKGVKTAEKEMVRGSVPEKETGRGCRRKLPRKLQGGLILVSISVLLAALAGVVLQIGMVSDFEIISTATQQILSWKKLSGVTGYELRNGSGKVLTTVGAEEAPQFAVNGLQSATRYAYTIVAVRELFGIRQYGKPVTVSACTAPEAVESAFAKPSGAGVLVTWTDAVGVEDYEVECTEENGDTRTQEFHGSGAEGCVFEKLQEGAHYGFRIRGILKDYVNCVYSEWTEANSVATAQSVDISEIDTAKPMIALTFDDGPDNNATGKILDTLQQYNGHATFFQLGSRAAEYAESLRRIAAEGHEIGSHTFSHENYGINVTAEDILSANDAIEAVCGVRPTVFRSPGGMTTDAIRQTCIEEGMPIYYWSIDTEDWDSRDVEAIFAHIAGNVSDGDIILLHNIYDPTAEAVKRIVPYLTERGYQLVTVSQLVQAKTGAPPVPGMQYYTATRTD